jgi:biotin carboxylase
MLTIYFNRTYATTAHLIQLLRANADGVPIRVIGSHLNLDSPVLARCDEAYPEPPAEVTGAAYVQWALDFTREHRVDVFFPSAQLAALAAAAERFTAQGVRLLAAPAAAVTLFDDKAAAYADAQTRGLPVPPYAVVRDGSSLLEAFERLSAVAEQVCVKPVSGVGGDGFRILERSELTIAELIGPARPVEQLSRVAAALDRANEQGAPPPALIVLPFLPGPEVSVDVLADRDGAVLAAVSRVKTGRRRWISEDAAALGVAQTLVNAHRLRYLSNTQVRYWRGPGDDSPRPYLLEVNPRLSAGLFQSALSGVDLAWSAVTLAMGSDLAPVAPRFAGQRRAGVSYTMLDSLLELPAGG